MEKRVDVIACLVDGCGIRTTQRLLDIHKSTITNLAVAVGEGCARVHDRLMRELDVSALQLDEQWSFVHTKQGNVRPDSPAEAGDQWVFLAFDVAHRAIISYLVDRRTGENTDLFVADVRRRVIGSPRISTDGFKPYVTAIEKAFGTRVSFGQLVKLYEPTRSSWRRGRFIGTLHVPISGAPEQKHINTSLVERANLTTRMSVRRFTRKTLSFSKKLRNHRAAIALHVAYYNFCRIHGSLRITPAMALGVTEHVWSIEELIREALNTAPERRLRDRVPPPTELREKTTADVLRRRPRGDALLGFFSRVLAFLRQEIERYRHRCD